MTELWIRDCPEYNEIWTPAGPLSPPHPSPTTFPETENPVNSKLMSWPPLHAPFSMLIGISEGSIHVFGKFV